LAFIALPVKNVPDPWSRQLTLEGFEDSNLSFPSLKRELKAIQDKHPGAIPEFNDRNGWKLFGRKRDLDKLSMLLILNYQYLLSTLQQAGRRVVNLFSSG